MNLKERSKKFQSLGLDEKSALVAAKGRQAQPDKVQTQESATQNAPEGQQIELKEIVNNFMALGYSQELAEAMAKGRQ